MHVSTNAFMLSLKPDGALCVQHESVVPLGHQIILILPHHYHFCNTRGYVRRYYLFCHLYDLKQVAKKRGKMCEWPVGPIRR